MNYYLIEGTDSDEKHLIQTENVEPSAIEQFMTAQLKGVPGDVMYSPGTGLRRGTPVHVYRKMCEAEFDATLRNKALQPNIKNPAENEMWLTESLEHSRKFDNKGVPRNESQVVADFEMKSREYRSMRNEAIPQKNSKAVQAERTRAGKPKANLYHYEQLPKDGPHRNLGMKGQRNINRQFNNALISVREIDPHAEIPNRNNLKVWIKANKLSVALNAIGVIADGITLTFAVLDDKGNFGNSTKLAIGDIVGSMAGAEIGAYIASSIGTALFPGVGTAVGLALGFICGLIGSLIGKGIVSFFLTAEWEGEGPGAPIMDTDPYTQKAPSMMLDAGATGVPFMGYSTGATGVPSMGVQTGATGFPKGNYLTRHDFDNLQH